MRTFKIFALPCLDKIFLESSRGADKFFKALAKLASRPAFSFAKTEKNWPKL
jgi:hypothetical protein